MVINTKEIVSATPLLRPRRSNWGTRSSDSLSAPKAARKPESVTPTYGGEEEVRIRRQLRDQLAALSSIGQLTDLALAEGDQSDFGGNKDRPDEHQQQISRMLRTTPLIAA